MKNARDAIEWAIGLAESLPDQYRVAAFSELLRYSLSLETNNENGTTSPRDMATLSVSSPDLKSVLRKIPEAHLVATKGDRDQQVAWAVAELFIRGDEATTQTIPEIIKNVLALAPPSKHNTGRSLQKLTPKYVMREKGEKGKAYSYSPTVNLVELFDNLKDSE